MYKIIKLNKRHIPALVQIDHESEHPLDIILKSTKADIKKGIIKRFNQGHEIWFGYKENNELKGYVSLKPFFSGHKHCELYWLAVKKKYPGQGIGKKLMKFIEAYAKKKGFRKVCLYTNNIMKKARKFYERIGYEYVNEFKGYYGYTTGNTTAVLYCKKI